MYRAPRERRSGSGRSRSRERRENEDPHDLVAVVRAQREGAVQLRKQTNLPKIPLDFTPGNEVPIEETSFDLEFRHASSQKASRITIKTLIDKETPKGMDIRRSSPSLVARLMGLDTLPPAKHKKERGTSSQKTSSVGFYGKNATHESFPLQTSSDEYQECKDVFEVKETTRIEKQNDKPFRKGMSSVGHSRTDLRPSDIDLAFAKQKFVDLPPTDDEFQSSKEYGDAVEDLVPNKNRFAKFLQEPNSLFRKHLQDLKCSPPLHGSQITILKPLRAAKSDNELCHRSGRNTERHTHSLNGDMSSCRKPVSNHANHSAKEHSWSFAHKLSEPLFAGKTKGQLQPAPIVILKPSLEKALDAERTVPLERSLDNYPHGLRRQKRIPVSRRSEVYGGGRERHKLSDSMEVMGHRTKGVREISRDITKQLRNSGSSDSVMLAGGRKYKYIRDESSHDMLGMENMELESHRWIFDQLNDSSDSLSTSSYYSAESFVNREARKRLSDRWKLIQQIQEVGPVDKGSSTLGEMLVSDREIPRSNLNASSVQSLSVEEVARDEILAKWDLPLGISSKDRKDGWSRNVSRSQFFPAPSFVYGKHRRNSVGVNDSGYRQTVLNKSPNDSLARNASQRRRSSGQSLNFRHNASLFYSGGEELEMSEREIHVNPEQLPDRIPSLFYSGREEPEMSEREIHVNPEQLPDRIHVTHPDEEVCMVPELFNSSITGRDQSGNLAPQCKDATFPVIVDNVQLQQSAKLKVQANDEEFSGADPDCVASKETPADRAQVSSLSSHYDIAESPSPVSSKEDQPSPVSVLDLPPSEEKASSECFEKISAGLKELRMQLKLLKLELADTDAEDLELLISSDEDIGECHSPQNSGETLEAFRDEEDRDFSYLLDVLIGSGVHSASKNGLFNACYIQEYTVDREVFEKLEKKYNVLVSWSKSERKLLFDLTCSILADIVTPSVDLQSMKAWRSRPTWAREGLVEDVWQLVVKQRKELSGKLEEQLLLDPNWLNLGGDMDMIGRDLERMVIDDLMEELLSQLI